MELAKCFEQFAFFHYWSWDQEAHCIAFMQTRKH